MLSFVSVEIKCDEPPSVDYADKNVLSLELLGLVRLVFGTDAPCVL